MHKSKTLILMHPKEHGGFPAASGGNRHRLKDTPFSWTISWNSFFHFTISSGGNSSSQPMPFFQNDFFFITRRVVYFRYFALYFPVRKLRQFATLQEICRYLKGECICAIIPCHAQHPLHSTSSRKHVLLIELRPLHLFLTSSLHLDSSYVYFLRQFLRFFHSVQRHADSHPFCQTMSYCNHVATIVSFFMLQKCDRT